MTDFANITNNLNELVSTLGTYNDALTYNTIIEDDIKNQGGVILYSYDNIIIASEISETYWSELQSSSNIEYIQDLPLKQYGGVDYSLIGQMSSNILFDSINQNINISDSATGKTSASNISGSTTAQEIINITNSGVTKTETGIYPMIINEILTL